MKQVCPDAGVLVERQGEAQKTSKRVHKMFSKILGQNTWQLSHVTTGNT